MLLRNGDRGVGVLSLLFNRAIPAAWQWRFARSHWSFGRRSSGRVLWRHPNRRYQGARDRELLAGGTYAAAELSSRWGLRSGGRCRARILAGGRSQPPRPLAHASVDCTSRGSPSLARKRKSGRRSIPRPSAALGVWGSGCPIAWKEAARASLALEAARAPRALDGSVAGSTPTGRFRLASMASAVSKTQHATRTPRRQRSRPGIRGLRRCTRQPMGQSDSPPPNARAGHVNTRARFY